MHVLELVRMGADIQVEVALPSSGEDFTAARTCKGNRFTGLCRPCSGALAAKASLSVIFIILIGDMLIWMQSWRPVVLCFSGWIDNISGGLLMTEEIS